MKHLSTLLIILLAGNFCFGQKEAANWYFGTKLGLKFHNSGTEVLKNSAMHADEGCATISDSLGNLLFYTNGIDVWNANHQKMPNGSGLWGSQTSTQSGIIVPRPESPGEYYVFTVDWQGRPRGIAYSTVNIALNAGLGDVVDKNIQLDYPACEKITAVKHKNQKDYWVIAHRWNSKDFLAYLVTKDGVRNEPVVSSVGSIHQGGVVIDGVHNNENTLGCMKASPNGKFLACALIVNAKTELFRFDNETGVLSSPKVVETRDIFPYGVEFSPDNKKLYIAGDMFIYQLDLRKWDQAAIVNSKTKIGTAIARDGLGTLQLGIDGKIYSVIKRYNHLGIIHHPNLNGTEAAYVQNAISLGNDTTSLGLPNIYPGYLAQLPFQAADVCVGDSTGFKLADVADIDSIYWDFGDVASGLRNFSKLIAPKHKYASPGKYTVTRILFNKYENDTASYDITIYAPAVVELGTDKQICTGDSVPLAATSSVPLQAWLWQDNKTITPGFWAKAEGKYKLVATDIHGCKAADSLNVSLLPLPKVFIGNDTILCNSNTLNLSNKYPASAFLWQDGSTNPVLTVSQEGRYILRATGENNCVDSDTIIVSHKNTPSLELGPDVVICAQPTPVLKVNVDDVSFLWQNGSSQPSLEVTENGWYKLKISNFCGSATDSVHYKLLDCKDPPSLINIFTPNDDGKNEKLSFPDIKFSPWEIYIYNRWGVLLYHSTNYQNDWDGEPHPEGVYYYILINTDTGKKYYNFFTLMRD
jgi:gliding motility-associated-like protein